MSAEENKAIVRRFLEEVWGKGNLTVLSEALDPNVIDHNPGPNQAPGIEGQRHAVNMFMSAFGNTHITIDSLIADGDKVVDHWTWSGTHKGDLMGIPPTGKTVTITGTDIARLANGKIVEFWHVEDTLGMMQQLGVIPAPGTQPQTGKPSAQAGRSGTGRSEPGTRPAA